jgi:hypothetical protein
MNLTNTTGSFHATKQHKNAIGMKPFETSVLIGDNADKMSFLVPKTVESTAPTALEYGTPSLVASAKDPGE